MLLLCFKCYCYAKRHNILFSTDPNPAKSKTKCQYMAGRVGRVVYPAPQLLNGVELPWVITAAHLGHQMHQNCKMEHHARLSRMDFVSNSTDIRCMFSFAHPEEIMKAIRVYCSSFYGCMLFDLYGDEAGIIYRTWNTASKLAWKLQKQTHTYIVKHFLCKDAPSLRISFLIRYVKFY